MYWFRSRGSVSIVIGRFMVIFSKKAGIFRGSKASGVGLTLVFNRHSLAFSIDWHEHP
jgi:hypothetical protein